MNQEDFFAHLTNHFQDQLPFVVYRKPKQINVQALLQEDDKLNLIKNYNESGFVFAPFNSAEDSVLIPSVNSKTLVTHFESLNVENEVYNESVITTDEYQDVHINLIKKGIDIIKTGELRKVVLSRCESVEFNESNPIETFKKLLQNYPKAFVYCWFHPKVGLWLGATPETLLQLDGNRLSTMALAGTQSYNNTLEVEWSQKEIEEQQYVTDFIAKRLKHSISNINVSKPITVKAGNLLHIKTKIAGTFNPLTLNFKQLLEDIHPTPAVCGLPKEKAKQFVLKNENYNREFYTGFLGELNIESKIERRSTRRNVENRAYNYSRKSSHIFVNLRCMQIKNDKALIYVGGGITKDSNPKDEWHETVNKTITMKKVL